MAAPLELRQKQRAVIEFLVAEWETPVNIHRRLQNVYMENTLDYSNVGRWVCRLNDEEVGTASVADKPRSGRPSSSVSPVIRAKADALIREDRRLQTIISSVPVKEGLRGQQYASDEEVKTAVKKCLKEQSTECDEAGTHAVIGRWIIAI